MTNNRVRATQNRVWYTMVVRKGTGGRSIILNQSKRGLFTEGERYYNHQLKLLPKGSVVNVTIRLSPTGRRMVQELRIKGNT
jgi:hypothetical protein